MPRFTLRDLFWLVLVVALALGWGLTLRKLERAEHARAIAEKDADNVAEMARQLMEQNRQRAPIVAPP